MDNKNDNDNVGNDSDNNNNMNDNDNDSANDDGQVSEGGTMRLETLVVFKSLDSSFSSSNFSIRAFRACPLVEARQAIPCRAIRADSISVSRTLPPNKYRTQHDTTL